MLLLLIIIYLAFISLGLPDALLGSAWPSMYEGLGVSIESAGIIAMIVSGGTILSSLFSGRVIRRFGTGVVTLVSVSMTAVALMGVSFLNSFEMLCLCAVPLGLGAGSVDAVLNNFVALHYKARHMSWVHCFWGVGASIGPIIMSYSLVQLQSWNAGYRTISITQFALVAVLLVSLPLWKKARPPANEGEEERGKVLSIRQLISLPKAKLALPGFFCYCAVESTVGLWGSTYLVTVRHIPAVTAAGWISLYYLGITLGRFFSGFLAIKLKHKQMIQLGQLLIGVAIIMLLLPIKGILLPACLFLIGLGCAPIFPSMLHETPLNFGVEHSQSMIGVEMASAYVGATLVPALFGLLGANLGYGLFPVFCGMLLLIMILMGILLHKRENNLPGDNKA